MKDLLLDGQNKKDGALKKSNAARHENSFVKEP